MTDHLHIHPDEKIVLKLRKHWLILLRDTMSSILLAFLPFILFAILQIFVPTDIDFVTYLPLSGFATALWLLIVWMALAVLWTDYYLDLWIVTDSRIISVDQVSLFHRTVTTLSLDKIQEVTVKTENVFETLFHFGTIEIETAGPSDLNSTMEGIPHPERVRAAIMAQTLKKNPISV